LLDGAGPTGLACGIELRIAASKLLWWKGAWSIRFYTAHQQLTFFTTPELLLEIGKASDDEPQRQAQSHGGAGITEGHGSFQAGCPPTERG
jgi:hypothetical protein